MGRHARPRVRHGRRRTATAAASVAGAFVVALTGAAPLLAAGPGGAPGLPGSTATAGTGELPLPSPSVSAPAPVDEVLDTVDTVVRQVGDAVGASPGATPPPGTSPPTTGPPATDPSRAAPEPVVAAVPDARRPHTGPATRPAAAAAAARLARPVPHDDPAQPAAGAVRTAVAAVVPELAPVPPARHDRRGGSAPRRALLGIAAAAAFALAVAHLYAVRVRLRDWPV